METVDGRNGFFIRWTAEQGKLQHTLQCAARNLISDKWSTHAQHNMSVINKANKKGKESRMTMSGMFCL